MGGMTGRWSEWEEEPHGGELEGPEARTIRRGLLYKVTNNKTRQGALERSPASEVLLKYTVSRLASAEAHHSSDGGPGC